MSTASPDTIKVVTESLIDFVVNRLAFNVRKYRLKKEVSIILYGETEDGSDEPKELITVGTFEKLCSKARDVMRIRASAGGEQAREESIGFYDNILGDDSVPMKYRLKARQNLDKIQKVADHNPGGGFNNSNSMTSISGTVNHRIIDVDKLGLTLEQKLALLKETRTDANDGTTND